MKVFLIVASLLFIVFIGSLSNTLAAQNIQYNYAELRYIIDADVNDSDIDGDGYAFGGSIRIDELFYAFADYESLAFDLNIDTTIVQGGMGFIVPFDKVNGIAELALVHGDADSNLGGLDETGYRLGAGVRGYITPDLELRATFNRIDLDEDDSYLTLAGDYFLSKDFSVNITKEWSAEVERLAIGIRYYLGE